MKRSFLAMLLLFCVALTGCQAGANNRGSYYAVVTNAPVATTTVAVAAAVTQAPTKTPIVEPIAASSVPPTEHLDAVVTSKTGKTTVTVDADVPLIDERPWTVYFCCPRMITEQELRNMAAACFGDMPYSGDQSYNVKYYEVGKYSTYEHTSYSMDFAVHETVPTISGIGTQPLASIYSIQMLLPSNIVEESFAEYQQAQQVGQNYYWTVSNDYPVDETKITDISLEDAQKHAEAVVQAFAPDYRLAAVSITQGELITKGDPDVLPIGRWGYMFTFKPLIDGRLATYSYGDFTSVEFMTPCSPDYIRVVVDGGGVQAVRWSGPNEITGEKGVYELLPWEQIEKIAWEILPLKFASSERYYTKVNIIIDEIKLGYTRVMSRNQPGVYELIPVWDFMGRTYLDNDDTGQHVENPWANKSQLTINAIDGTIIDRTYGY